MMRLPRVKSTGGIEWPHPFQRLEKLCPSTAEAMKREAREIFAEFDPLYELPVNDLEQSYVRSEPYLDRQTKASSAFGELIKRVEKELRVAQITQACRLEFESRTSHEPEIPKIETAPPEVIRLPGYRIYAAAEFIFTQKAFPKVTEPILDMWLEYTEALAQSREVKARWIVVRGLCAFFAGLILRVPTWIRSQVKIANSESGSEAESRVAPSGEN